MRRRPRTIRWGIVILSVASAYLFLGAALLTDGIVLASENQSSSTGSSSPVPVQPTSGVKTEAGCNVIEWLQTCGPPVVGPVCQYIFSNPALEIIPVLLPFGPACTLDLENQIAEVNQANTAVAIANLGFTTYDFLNQTAALVADLNSTFQELLSYYESRAEAIVPYFLSIPTWNQTVADQLLISSGLIPSLAGVEYAFGQQEYQDWNATASEWNAAFGSAGALMGHSAAIAYGQLRPNTSLLTIATSGTSIGVTPPWEYYQPEGANPIYVNVMPGGTLIDANFFNYSLGSAGFASYKAYDLTQGTSFIVPFVNFTNWAAQNVPIVTTLHNVSQFDLLKLVCVANCTQQPYVEALGGYAIQPRVPYTHTSGFSNTMVPQLFLKPIMVNAPTYPVPSPWKSVCFSDTAINGTFGPCSTSIIPTGGFATQLSSGPGQTVGGNNTEYGFPQTAEQLVNNTETMAYDYWLTLRAITDKGRYNIPATCSIPTPSDAFPVSTNFQNYNLSANNVEGVYLGYLSAVFAQPRSGVTNITGFCGNPNLGMEFNWTGSWNLRLNVTASVYVSNSTTPLFLNGTADPASTYSNPASWPVYNIDPTLLYPVEFQMNVPLNTVYPVPINDPLVGILVNWSGNLYYGHEFKPAWGMPTYITLGGHGNYIFVSGSLSNIGSHSGSNATGDAIDIKSCVLNGVSQNPCDLSVTYFDNFTIGLVHAISSPAILTITPPSGLGALGNTCGFSSLNQFYDGWAGYIGSAIANSFFYVGGLANGIPLIGGGIAFLIDGLGCIIAWIIVILLFAVFVYVAVRVGIAIYSGTHGRRRSRPENVA